LNSNSLKYFHSTAISDQIEDALKAIGVEDYLKEHRLE